MIRCNGINKGNSISRPLPIPSFVKFRSILTIKPTVSGDSEDFLKNYLANRAEKKSDDGGEDAFVQMVDDTPQSHPPHVPNPTTLQGIRPEDVHEVLFDTIPLTFEKIFCNNERSTSLGGAFWTDCTLTMRQQTQCQEEYIHTTSPLPKLLRLWEIENSFNLHQGISSRRLLDKDSMSGRDLGHCNND
ncbi:hypothetical protein IV203_027283 [Nitzschia inconspicua]|uniref:Uncharacterized protein n=1 Tax=Nitzschia inconspicua TaxID=303405 RepID=A0A9K3Q368_9STRA|nr:hypothetical protein IV203_027283 [Nitzschia inconspicua]